MRVMSIHITRLQTDMGPMSIDTGLVQTHSEALQTCSGPLSICMTPMEVDIRPPQPAIRPLRDATDWRSHCGSPPITRPTGPLSPSPQSGTRILREPALRFTPFNAPTNRVTSA